MIPTLRAKGLKGVNLPTPSGGVNTYDAAEAVKDDQMSSGFNMVFSKGRFSVRGGFNTFKENLNYLATTMPSETFNAAEGYSQRMNYDIPKCVTNFYEARLFLENIYKYSADSESYQKISLDKNISGIYISHNHYRSQTKTIADSGNNNWSGYVNGCINAYAVTEDGKNYGIYFFDKPTETDRKENDTNKNPGNTVFNCLNTRFMIYSGTPVLNNGLGLFCWVVGGWTTTKTARLYELQHIKDYGFDGDTAGRRTDYKENFENKNIRFAFARVPESKYYAPLVYVNGKGAEYSSLPSSLSADEAPASFFEGYNVLTPRFRASFTTDGYSLYDDSGNLGTYVGSHMFEMPIVLDTKMSGSLQVLADDFNVKYTDGAGKEYNWTVPKGTYFKTFTGVKSLDVGKSTTTNITVSLTFNKNGTQVSFRYEKSGVGSGDWELAVFPRATTNNLEFSGAVKGGGANELFSSFGGCEWFGGTSGIKGGTRLFFYGSRTKPNLIMWSDVSNPLYLPENNSASVGNQNDRVTRLAHQSNMLVIFKTHSCYYTTYVDNSSSYTAEQVLAGTVSDVAAVSAMFPISQISEKVGCDLPRTVQLCDNHLVWCTTDGGIYTLKTADKYSENNIYELSSPISNELKKQLALTDTRDLTDSNTGRTGIDRMNVFTFAADFDGKYWLCVDNLIYVMNYSDSGFKYAYSYREGNKVKRSVSFYILDIENFCERTDCSFYTDAVKNGVQEIWRAKSESLPRAFIASGEQLHLITDTSCYLENSDYFMGTIAAIFKYGEYSTDGGVERIEKMGKIDGTSGSFKTNVTLTDYNTQEAEFTTKSFSFSDPAVKKRIEHIYFTAASADKNGRVTVSLATDLGEKYLYEYEIFETEPTVRHIRCGVHGVRTAALKFKIEGTVQIGNFAIKYKTLF